MPDLLRNPYVIIETLPGTAIVRFKRTARTGDPEEAREVIQGVVRVLDSIDRRRYCFLMDLRDGPMRNDPEFEEGMATIRARLFHGFLRVAILVRTQVGKLQVSRLAREDGVVVNIFDDEATAISHLMTPPPSQR